MVVRVFAGRVVIVAHPLPRNWLMVEACETDDAENLTRLTDFPNRKMKTGDFVAKLGELISEAEAGRVTPRAKQSPTGETPSPGALSCAVDGEPGFDDPSPSDRSIPPQNPEQLERLAHYLASKGRAEVEWHQAIVNRALEMMAAPGFEPANASELKAVRRLPFPWEIDHAEGEPASPNSIYLASAEDFATGEGMTVYFGAGYGRSESEFRRRLAAEWGVWLADSARVARGADADVPFRRLFVTPALRSFLRKAEKGDEGPGSLSFFARQHANYS